MKETEMRANASKLVILPSGRDHKAKVCDDGVFKLHGDDVRSTKSAACRYLGVKF